MLYVYIYIYIYIYRRGNLNIGVKKVYLFVIKRKLTSLMDSCSHIKIWLV